MKKRLASFLLVIVIVVSSVFVAIPTAAISDAEFVAPEITIPGGLVVPDNDMLTDNTEYYLAEGSRWQQKVTAEFMQNGFKSRNGTYNYQKYIIIHNTGAYPATSTALANHNYGRTTTAEVSWHFTAGNDGLYQMLPVNEKGWHAGGNYWGDVTNEQKKAAGWIEDCSNSTGVGIETATPGFPADSTSAGEHWNKPEMYEWYETTFDKTATYLAELVASLCVRMNFNPYTQIAQHYSSAKKNCPMQMRYVFGTAGTFQFDGTYFKVFLDRMYDYYEAFGGSYKSTDTFKNEYYNKAATVYKKGLYKATVSTTVYRAGNTTTETVGTLAANEVVDVKVVGFDWGKIKLANGTEGWVKLTGLTYVTGDYDYGTYRTASGDIIEITKIDGTTGTYSGGTVDMKNVTRVYKVEVAGDTAFGSAAKYMASGETFTVTAAAATGISHFDVWETTYGVAGIADQSAETTTVTVRNTDIKLTSSYTDKQTLTVEYGSGSGRYGIGEEVKINAFGRAGYAFIGWTLKSGQGTFGDANSASTTFTMGSTDAVVSATYEPRPYYEFKGKKLLSVGKSYTFSWKGLTGDSIAWYTNANTKDNGTKLTDGKTATEAIAFSTGVYIAVMGTGGNAEVVIDLGEVQTIVNVAIRDTYVGETSFNGIKEGSCTIEVSSDGSEYAPVEALSDDIFKSWQVLDDGTCVSLGDEKQDTHVLSFSSVDARYVKVKFQSDKYVLAFSEVEVWGPDPDATEDPSSEAPSEEPSSEAPSEEPSSEEPSEEPKPAKLGDVNGDGKVDNLDAAVVLQYDAGLISEIENGDVNKDGLTTNLDAAKILQFDAGLIDNFD